ncbi:MAG: HD domain-containing phosphohydrolase [Brevinematia bacterium]
MLKSILKLLNKIQETLTENVNLYSISFPKLCEEILEDKINFGIYINTPKGYLNTFRNRDGESVLKDIVNQNEISKNFQKYNGGYYIDLFISSRKYQREVLIRIVLHKDSISEDEIEIVNETIRNFYTFQELYNKDYILNQLIKILEETTEASNIEEVIQETTKITKKLLNVEGASILMKDEKNNELFFKVIDSEKSNEIKEIRIPIDRGIAGYTARTGNPLIVNDVKKHPEFYSNVDDKSGFITKSIISAPIKPLNKIIGVIEAVNKIRETDFTEDDLKILEMIAQILGINLLNSILYEKLNNTSRNTIKALITALEARDEYTKGHSYRVQIYSVKIAHALKLPSKKVEEVELSAILHDVGKIGIPDNILRKTEKLSNEEFEIIKKHPIIGYNILRSVEGLENVLDGIKYHHERFDGRGYPEGLKGKEIPLVARIISVADTLDAITSDRPYRKGLPFEYALEEIKKVKGSQLDPEIVETFLNSFTKIEEIKLI